ncbi:MAG: hypothetical protein HW383_520 [Candidatus Magasanikbacteria bacterium]|nr:hypothetical protein [Candidatus Magasanikbacteria bacterium]
MPPTKRRDTFVVHSASSFGGIMPCLYCKGAAAKVKDLLSQSGFDLVKKIIGVYCLYSKKYEDYNFNGQ